ncbi:hypothetical protein DBR23_23495 [Acidovorax sp. HMWF018]|uniref:phage protein NinX family protein n=1 Tax=Acidovorax sp. HMWF018 TaxID=2056855 RepID=UPI000D3BB664|nr:phage protein NinX family protein [Acidovorax sp. HMWF018]PTT35472.1 hypothetical protein DBR23_23495 [Acidovorax sp. HMWF018]
MTTIKTSELTGAALDWAVARAEGKRPSMFIFQRTGALADEHHYSTNWAQGGPIIEREGIATSKPNAKGWLARSYLFTHYTSGPTALIAAMRCRVASKLGDEVEVPEELLS